MFEYYLKFVFDLHKLYNEEATKDSVKNIPLLILKGLQPAVEELIPYSEHRFCARHLHNNLTRVYPGDAIKDMLWKCAKATYCNKFEAKLKNLRGFDEGAYNWLQSSASPEHWSKSYFREDTQCDILLNNHSEVFNKNILAVRSKFIPGLLEGIRMYLMLRLQKQRQWISRKKRRICPHIMKRLEKLKNASAMYYASYSRGRKFQVTQMDMEQFALDTQDRTCTCH
ncbi:hypothetical protein M9H77_09077 [Catharanthus roseus]|uniref:Uncharacterized protein n=1 Tax=Catharanthus roseus TaxID=4058 RepID=A0ACC0BZI0_CATRO|nr:hypothetical protein M9H77_09077 [Catharanthus roseus]